MATETVPGGVPARARASRRLGVVYMLLSALAASSSGILVRLVEDASAWQVLCWRSLAFAGLFLVVLTWRYRGALPQAFRRIGWVGVAAAVCLGLTYVAYLTAMFLTSIAAAVILFSLSPVFAALLALLFLGERPRRGAWLWMLLALGGVAVMMLGESGTQSELPHRRLGMVVALAATLGYALAVVVLRAKRESDLRPSFVLAGLVAFALSLPLAGSLVLGLADTAIAITLGVVSLGLQYLFLERAARHLQADEMTLLALVEVFIAPFWVWLGVGEAPGIATVAGGSAVVAAVAGLTLVGGKSRRTRDGR